MKSLTINGKSRTASCRLSFVLLTVILMSVLLSGNSQASLINVDFNGYRSDQDDPIGGSPYYGIGPAGGGTWNQLPIVSTNVNTSYGAGEIVNSASNVTAVTIALASWSGSDWLSGTGGNAGNDLLRDYLLDTAGTATITIGGLDTSKNYNLYIFANQGWNGATLSVNGSATQTTIPGVSENPPLVEGGDYVLFTVFPNETGELIVTVTGAGSRLVNGFQLEEVIPTGTIFYIR